MIVQVKLELKEASNAQILVDATDYTGAMTGNSYFTAAAIVAQVGIVVSATTNLRTEVNLPYSVTKTGVVNTAREALERGLKTLAHQVEGVANDPAVLDINRVNIVHSAAMNEKTHTNPGKHVFKAEKGSTPLSVKLTAEGGALSNSWKYSADPINFTGVIYVDGTSRADNEIPALIKNHEYAFWHQGIHAKGNTAWEGPILFTVTQ